MKQGWIRTLLAAVIVWQVGVASWAQDATQGGVVVVDGHTLAHHFVKKGASFYFPVTDMAQALGKTAVVQGDSVVWDGKPAVPVITVDGVPYLEYHSLTELVPNVQFGMTADEGRAVFSTHAAYQPKGPAPGSKTTANSSGEAVSLVDCEMLPDQNRANKLTIDATFMNNTKTSYSGLKVQLVIADLGGITGEAGKPKAYAEFEQPLGDLLPGAAKKVTFETDIVNASNIDSTSHTFTVDVSGLEMGQATTVPLTCQFHVAQDK